MAVGRTGNISFTGVFDPVLVDGSTIGRATLHNMAFIRDRDIRIGDKVVVKKANGVIPRIENSLPEFRPENATIYDPEPVCPVSGEPLDTSGAIWRSPAPEASIGALISYASSRDALDVEGVSDAVATALVSGDKPLVNGLADLCTVTEAQLAALPLNDTKTGTARTLGVKNAAKIAAEIEKAKKQPLNRVMTALGIRKSGRTFGRRLAVHFHTMDALLAATESDFLASGVEGVGPERARLFYEGFQRLRPTIDKLRDAGVNLGTGAEQDGTDPSAKPLSGMKAVVTGAMTGPLAALARNEMNELLELLGATASGSVSKATSLVVASDLTSSKAVKAAQLGIESISPEEFAVRIGGL